jgi:lysophospholipase L1-like esterase
MNCELIDTYSYFAEDGELPERYTIDGIHLNGAGIVRWVEFLTKCIKDDGDISDRR